MLRVDPTSLTSLLNWKASKALLTLLFLLMDLSSHFDKWTACLLEILSSTFLTTIDADLSAMLDYFNVLISNRDIRSLHWINRCLRELRLRCGRLWGVRSGGWDSIWIIHFRIVEGGRSGLLLLHLSIIWIHQMFLIFFNNKAKIFNLPIMCSSCLNLCL